MIPSIFCLILLTYYPWPMRNFDSPHAVSATLGDARSSVTSPRFHRGIDIPANAGTNVFSIFSGRAYHTQSGDGIYVGNFWYIHLVNMVESGTEVLGIVDTVNTPPDRIGDVAVNHLHFQIGPSSGPFVNPLSYSGGPVGYDDTGDPTCSIDFWRQGSEGGTAQQLVGVLDGKVDIRAYCQDIQTSGGSNQTSGIYRLDWFIRNINTGQSFGPFQTTIFPQVQPPNNGNPVLLVYDRHNYSNHSPFYYWTTNPIISNQVVDRYWNTKQKINEPDSVDADSIENAKFPDGNYWVKVMAYDIRNNADSESLMVKIGNFNPEVRETEPDDGETGVSIHQTVYVRFSEAMDSMIDLRSAVTISPGVNGDWEWLNQKSILFTPDPAFLKNTTYTVALSSQLEDLQEQTLVPYSFSFTTDTTEDREFYPTKPDWEGYIPWWDVSVSWFDNYYTFQIFWNFSFPFYGYGYDMIIFNRRGSIWFDTNRDWCHFDLPTAGGSGQPVMAVYNDSLRHLWGHYSRGRSRELSNPNRELVRWTYTYYADTTEFEAVLFADGTIKFNYIKCDVDIFNNDGGSGISKGDGIHYSSITEEYGPVYELAPAEVTWPSSYIATDNPPPGYPRDLDTTTAEREDSISLIWRANPEPDLAGYCIYRADVSYCYSAIPYDTIWPPDTTYTDTSPMLGNNYYVVTAFDNNGLESRYSNQVRVVIDSLPPSPPTNLVASYDSINQIVFLLWNASSDPYLALYRIYRSEISGSYRTPLDSVAGSDTTFSDSTMTLGKIYYYVVTAVDSSNNESNYSNEDTVDVPVKFMSYSSLASAYNNGLRMVRNSTAEELFLSYTMNDTTALCTSTDDDGVTWFRSAFVGPGSFPSMAMDSDTNLHCIFRGIADMDFLGGTSGDKAYRQDNTVIQNSIISEGSASIGTEKRATPSFSAMHDPLDHRPLYYTIGHATYDNGAWQNTSLYETQDSILSVSFAIDPLDTGWVVFNTYDNEGNNELKIGQFYTQTLPESLDNVTTLDTYNSYGKAAVIVRPSDRSIWIVYERNNTIVCKWRNSYANWITSTIQNEGVYPSLSIAGDLIHFIWEKYYSEIDRREIQTCNTSGFLWTRPQTIAVVNCENCYPYIEKGAVAVWADFAGNQWEVYSSQRTSGNWTTPQNISQTSTDSKYPQVAMYQTISQTNLVYVWTEGDQAPYEVKILPVSLRLNPVPLYAFNLGKEKPSVFLKQRSGYVIYEQSFEKSADYDTSFLHYTVTGLDPDKIYHLGLVFYQDEANGVWEQEIEIDNCLIKKINLPRKKTINEKIVLSQEDYQDGIIELKIKKLSGPKVVLNAMSVWEFSKEDHPVPFAKESSMNVPQEFNVLTLSNPVKDKSLFHYQLPKACQITIKIYSISGQLVREIKENKPAGLHTTIWDGKDTKGIDVASGIYFYRVESTNITKTGKIIFLR